MSEILETPGGSGLFDVIGETLVEDPPGSGLYMLVGVMIEDPAGSGLYASPLIAAPVEPIGGWSLDLCRGWVRIGEAVDMDFAAVIRFLDSGEWALSAAPAAVSFGYYLDGAEWREWKPIDVDTIRLVYNNTLEFAGYVQPVSDGAAGFEKVIDAGGERWTWSGPDLWGGLLNSRVAYPDPATELGWVDTHDTNTGIASTVLTDYLNDNMGVTALAAREIAGFTVADELEGMSDTWTARLQPIDELVKRICNDAELVCRITIDFNGNITTTIGVPRDLSAQHVISDQGDLSLLRVRYEDPRKTYVIAGGPGTGTSRTFRASNSGAMGEARRELFIDQSSLDSPTELLASAVSTRRLAGGAYSVYAELTDTAATELQYLRDYQIGDSVAVQVDEARFVVPITSVAFQVNADRQVVRPTLGTAVPDALKGLLRKLSLVSNRSANSIS